MFVNCKIILYICKQLKREQNMLNYVCASFYYFYLYFTNTCEAEVCVP